MIVWISFPLGQDHLIHLKLLSSTYKMNDKHLPAFPYESGHWLPRSCCVFYLMNDKHLAPPSENGFFFLVLCV